MNGDGIAPSSLQDRLEVLGVDLTEGDVDGHIVLDSALNLNAMVIGLGLENIEFEPEQFPGLVYHLDEPQVTIVLFGSGVITTVDGSNEDAVAEALEATVERLEDIGLLVADSSPAVEVNSETIPIAEELDSQD